MNVLFLVTIYTFWAIYIGIEGLREANFKHLKKKANLEINLPKLCNIQRFLVLSIMSFSIFAFSGMCASILSFFSMALVAPMTHNLFYFGLKNRLNLNITQLSLCYDCELEEENPSIYLSYKLRKLFFIIGSIINLIIIFYFIKIF